MDYKIINRHLSWISQGYSFRGIEAIRTELQQFSNSLTIGTRKIHECIGGRLSPFFQEELGKLTYLFIEDEDFDGDLNFLKYCPNLRQLYISGKASSNKISSLEPIRGLKQLELLNLRDQDIYELDALTGLQELEELILSGNPLKTIASIKRLPKLSFKTMKNRRIRINERGLT